MSFLLSSSGENIQYHISPCNPRIHYKNLVKKISTAHRLPGRTHTYASRATGGWAPKLHPVSSSPCTQLMLADSKLAL